MSWGVQLKAQGGGVIAQPGLTYVEDCLLDHIYYIESASRRDNDEQCFTRLRPRCGEQNIPLYEAWAGAAAGFFSLVSLAAAGAPAAFFGGIFSRTDVLIRHENLGKIFFLAGLNP